MKYDLSILVNTDEFYIYFFNLFKMQYFIDNEQYYN